MSNQHEHHDCEHQVKYCKVCDVAYCTKCGKEWKSQQYHWYLPQWTYTYSGGNYAITPTDSTATAGTSHAH